MEHWINIFPISLILIASQVVFLSEKWKTVLIALAVIYLGIFVLLLQLWPVTLASAKLIVGWMCAAIISFALPQKKEPVGSTPTSKLIFKGISLLFIWVIALLVTPAISQLFQVSTEIAFTAFAVFGCGLLQLGMSSRPFVIIIGILTTFAGFELLYAALESSILVNGLILAVNLLIAFIGSYVLMNQQNGENE